MQSNKNINLVFLNRILLFFSGPEMTNEATCVMFVGEIFNIDSCKSCEVLSLFLTGPAGHLQQRCKGPAWHPESNLGRGKNHGVLISFELNFMQVLVKGWTMNE